MNYKEKVIALLSNKELSKEQKEKLENIFPELKESEDEMVRKAIIQFFELQDDNTTYSLVPKKDILAWLEKQKEFVSADFDDVWETADCDELTAPLEKYSKDAIKEMCHAWYDKGIELERRNRDRIEISFDTEDNELQEITYYIPKGFHAEMGDDKVVIKKDK